MAALLMAALAAASVSAATSSHQATAPVKLGTGAKLKNKVKGAKLAGTGKFVPSSAHNPGFIPAKAPANANAIKQHDRLIPGKLGPKGAVGSAGAVGSSASAVPHAPSLPILDAHAAYTSAMGLNAYSQDAFGAGYIDTPPDQALAEGNGFVFEAVNNVFQISDTNFNHITNAEPMEQFWAPALLVTGYCSVSDPKAYYDNVTRKWYVTEVAYGPPGCAPGSAVFIAVSTTSDPLSIYNIYVLDTSFDGTTCGPDGCLADQPLLGMNRNALFISTNSFDWDSPAFNGAQMYIIDSTALAAGFVFPNIAYGDLGASFNTPEFPNNNFCGVLGYPFSAYCWYSVQPATSPNLTQTTGFNGTEFALSALDWLGSNDNRIAMWAFTNTSSISAFFPNIWASWAIAPSEAYGFPFTDTPFYSPYAEQPNVGNTPFCDLSVGPFCEPGPIANNDDRMNEVKAIAISNGTKPAHVWGGLNTDASVPDPIGHNHRRSAIAYFDAQPTLWGVVPGTTIAILLGARVNNQGYIANWNNDVVFPAIGVGQNGTSAAIVYTLTGNTNFPSVAVSKVTSSSKVTSIPVVRQGQDVLDDFAWYFFGTPRWGDYSAAVGDGSWVYLATEYIQYPSCSDADFLVDPQCPLFNGVGTRSEFTNWGTGLVKVNV